MINIQNLDSSQLRKVIAIKERIEELEAQLTELIGSPAAAPAKVKTGRRTMSAAAKARIAAAQRARWAKVHAAAGKTGSPAAAAPGKRRKLNPAARAKLAAIAKARWAKVKASGKTKL
ncbi:MAG TPA: hypothetical protein VHB20_04985 [Verrucomicrobiae bacterium]|nr:hypothetical protein [Verrucomicrobiae bacterium]